MTDDNIETVANNMPERASFALAIDDVGTVMGSLRRELQSGSGIAYEDGELFVPPQYVAEVADAIRALPLSRKLALIDYAAVIRWQTETAGIVVSGTKIATDDRSKQMIQGARIAADADDTFTTPWVAADGSIQTMNAAAIKSVSDAVTGHVRGCFVTYASVVAAIREGRITTQLQIDSADWPH